jgi:hypothetical protein
MGNWWIEIKKESGGEASAQAEAGEQANANGNEGDSIPEMNCVSGRLKPQNLTQVDPAMPIRLIIMAPHERRRFQYRCYLCR